MKNTVKNVLYILGGIICLFFTIGLLSFLYSFLKLGIFIIIGFVFCCVFFPFLMRRGLKTLYKELSVVRNLLCQNVKIIYNYSKILSGFAQVLLLFWIIVPAILLIPASVVCAAVLIPISAFMLVVEAKVSQIWEDFGWQKRYYWLMNISIYMLGITLGSILNILLY